MATRKGTIKKTELSEFANIRGNGIIAMGVDDDDELLAVEITDGAKRIFIATREGMAICFEEKDVRPMGRPAQGVRGIRFGIGTRLLAVEHVIGRVEHEDRAELLGFLGEDARCGRVDRERRLGLTFGLVHRGVRARIDDRLALRL